ncbi:MAG: hypothetical protein IJC16_01300 [Rikenellaceae bacterium]|nr:hypothetical protein [Rikenellaceae bacterium]
MYKPAIVTCCLLLMLCVLLPGCSSSVMSARSAPEAGKSAFAGDNVRPGMTRAEFVRLNGEPYKTAFSDEPGRYVETLYYKERLGIWYVLNMSFRFVNDRLVAQEQLGEERLYVEGCCSGKND